jgi:hypothetical protein
MDRVMDGAPCDGIANAGQIVASVRIGLTKEIGSSNRMRMIQLRSLRLRRPNG